MAGNRPGDILGTLAAIQFAMPGDVVVAQAHGHRGCASGGDRVMGMLKNRGAAGFVTDGPLRDMDGLEAVGLPCWCTGLTPNSPVKSGPGSVGLPVDVGGQRVAQGDVVVADRDGVVIVPFEELDAVIAAVGKVAEAEARLDAEVANGRDGSAEIARMLEKGVGVEWL
ncbi:MAG: RraA family protein [Pseudomonadota bacterium]